MIFEVISFIIAVIGIPASIDYYPRKFPIIKKCWYLIRNNYYTVKITGTKKYIPFKYDLKTIKNVTHIDSLSTSFGFSSIIVMP